MASFLCTVQYGEKGHEILLEVWLVNTKPRGQTSREEVEQALRDTAASGVPPEGWLVSVMNWSHPHSAKESGSLEDLQRFDTLIRSADIEIVERERPPRRQTGEEEET